MPRKTRPAPKSQPESGTREQYLVAALRQLERQVKSAERDRSWVAAVHAKRQAMATRAELDQLRETQRRLDAPTSTADHKAEVLSEVRRLRVGATEAGSFVAASHLLRLERDLLSQTAAESTAAEADAMAKKTIAELQAEIDELQARGPVH